MYRMAGNEFICATILLYFVQESGLLHFVLALNHQKSLEYSTKSNFNILNHRAATFLFSLYDYFLLPTKSNNKVPELIVSYKSGFAHKPIAVDSVCSCYDHRRVMKKLFQLNQFIHSSPVHKCCTKLGNSVTQMYKMLETVDGNQDHTSLNGTRFKKGV
jgi:hypothetical protein